MATGGTCSSSVSPGLRSGWQSAQFAAPSPRPPDPSGLPGDPRTSWKGWILLAVLLLSFYVWTNFASQEDAQPEITYTAFYQAVQEGRVASVTIKGQSLMGKFKGAQEVEGKKLLGGFGLAGQEPGSSGPIPVAAGVHGPIVLANRVYFAYGTSGEGALQIVDRRRRGDRAHSIRLAARRE